MATYLCDLGYEFADAGMTQYQRQCLEKTPPDEPIYVDVNGEWPVCVRREYCKLGLSGSSPGINSPLLLSVLERLYKKELTPGQELGLDVSRPSTLLKF